MPERLIGLIENKYFALAWLAWAARLAMYRSGLTLGIIARQFFISAFVGYVATDLMLSANWDAWIKTTTFCLCVFLADDILVVIGTVGHKARKDPAWLLGVLRGLLGGKK